MGKRDYSRMELRKKILSYSESLEIGKTDLDLILDDLEKKDWLSDDRFSEQFVSTKKKEIWYQKNCTRT